MNASITEQDSGPPRLKVSFDTVSGAEAYMVEFADQSQPVRVEPGRCTNGTCEIAFDRLSIAGASSFTVVSRAGDQVSEPSEPSDVPAWPDRSQQPETGPTEVPADQPVELAVVKAGADGGPVFETVRVPADQDVEERITELEKADDVLGVSIAGIPENAQTQDTQNPATDVAGASDGEEPQHAGGTPSADAATTRGFPPGIGMWQQEALNFDLLPEEPRGDGVTVAVIDDGIYPNHPIITRADVTEENVVEPGRDAPGVHATGVASMIVGEGNALVPGIAKGATIHAYDIYNDEGFQQFHADDAAEAIVKAVNDGADVINVSSGFICKLGDCPDGVLRPAIDYAEENGVFVVASAGNDGPGGEWCEGATNNDAWPAAFSSVITVGGNRRDGSRWPCTPEKSYIDVLAPAYKLRVADSPSGYLIRSGTSYASPLVAGLVAAILTERPDLTPTELREHLRYAKTENGRLLTSVLLDQLDLLPEGEPNIDLTSGQEFIKFSMGLYFPTGSEVWRLAGLTQNPVDPSNFENPQDYFDAHDDYYPWGPATLEWSVLNPFTVYIGGLLVIDDEGNVTGSGGTQLTTHGGAYQVKCPEGVQPIPEFTFGFDPPVVVSGNVRDDGSGRSGDLTLTLGEDAEPGKPGHVSAARVFEDNLDRCQAEIAEADTTFTEPDFPWSEVSTWPNRKRNLVKPLYRQIIGQSPFRIEDSFFPPMGGGEDVSAYTSSGTTASGIPYRLRVGDINLVQL